MNEDECTMGEWNAYQEGKLKGREELEELLSLLVEAIKLLKDNNNGYPIKNRSLDLLEAYEKRRQIFQKN